MTKERTGDAVGNMAFAGVLMLTVVVLISVGFRYYLSIPPFDTKADERAEDLGMYSLSPDTVQLPLGYTEECECVAGGTQQFFEVDGNLCRSNPEKYWRVLVGKDVVSSCGCSMGAEGDCYRHWCQYTGFTPEDYGARVSSIGMSCIAFSYTCPTGGKVLSWNETKCIREKCTLVKYT